MMNESNKAESGKNLNSPIKNQSFRILVLDDEDEYHDIFERALADDLYSAPKPPANSTESPCAYGIIPSFDMTFCTNSEDAVFQIKQSVAAKKPFSLAFLDIRLESNFDGVWAAEQIRAIDQCLEIVMVSAFNDYSPQEIAHRVPPVDKIVYIRKPFSINQIIHFSRALVRKWKNEQDLLKIKRELEKIVRDRTQELEEKNLRLQEEIFRRTEAEDGLIKAAEELEKRVRERTSDLEQKNIALEVLLNKREEDKIKLRETIVSNAKTLLMPIIEKIKGVSSINTLQSLVNILELNLNEIISPLIGKLSLGQYGLTYMENQVAHYVRIGMTNKEMADIFGVSIGTILSHRHNLRKKLGITNKKLNLRSYLQSLE